MLHLHHTQGILDTHRAHFDLTVHMLIAAICHAVIDAGQHPTVRIDTLSGQNVWVQDFMVFIFHFLVLTDLAIYVLLTYLRRHLSQLSSNFVIS